MDGHEPLTALPSEWISRLFLRFRAIYGAKVDQMWGTTDERELLQTWADELRNFSGDDIRLALASMGDKHVEWPPTLYEFAELCRAAIRRRSNAALKLDSPRVPMPEHIQRQLDAFRAKHRMP